MVGLVTSPGSSGFGSGVAGLGAMAAVAEYGRGAVLLVLLAAKVTTPGSAGGVGA